MSSIDMEQDDRMGNLTNEGDHVVGPEIGRLQSKGNTITISASGTVRAAAKSAQEIYKRVSPNKDYRTEAVTVFLNAAKQKDEIVVKMAMDSPDTSFVDIGLPTNELTENDARIALHNYYSIRDGKRSFWKGVGAAILTGAVLTVITIILRAVM